MESDSYTDEVRQAYAEWQAAANYFDNVADPDLVDFAIFDMEAARKKYSYMLKKARKYHAERRASGEWE